MSMKKIGELYFPDEEKHFLKWAQDITGYQKPQRDKALTYVTDFSLAVDVGAHVGIFSRHFAQQFARVIAFEPMANLRECLRLNVPEHVTIEPYAVTDRIGSAQIYGLSTHNSGCSFICDDERVDKPDVPEVRSGEGVLVDVETVSIDSLGLPSLGLLKVDAQGSDHLVLEGAIETLKRCKPVALIEEKPVGGPDGPTDHIRRIHAFMTSIGATTREKVGADRIFTFA